MVLTSTGLEFEFEFLNKCYYSKQTAKNTRYYKADVLGVRITNICPITRMLFLEARTNYRKSKQTPAVKVEKVEKIEPIKELEQPKILEEVKTAPESNESEEEDIYGDVEDEDDY